MEIPALISSVFKLFEMVPTLLLFDSVMSHRKFAAVCCAMRKSRHARNNMKSGMQVMARLFGVHFTYAFVERAGFFTQRICLDYLLIYDSIYDSTLARDQNQLKMRELCLQQDAQDATTIDSEFLLMQLKPIVI